MRYLSKQQINKLEQYRQQCLTRWQNNDLPNYWYCSSGDLNDCHFPYIPTQYQTECYIQCYYNILLHYKRVLQKKQEKISFNLIPLAINLNIKQYEKQKLLQQCSLLDFIEALLNSVFVQEVPEFIVDKLKYFMDKMEY